MNKNNKKKNRLFFRAIVLLILLAAVVYALVSNLNKDTEVVEVGDVAPNFSLNQVNGNKTFVLHEDFKGKGVMVNFWATYCEPCKDEMPYMQELYPKYKEMGVEILAVSLDSTQLVINNFLENYEFTFPVVHDKSGVVMDLYNVFNIPSTYFINADGTVERKIEGPLKLSELEEYLEEIVPESEK